MNVERNAWKLFVACLVDEPRLEVLRVLRLQHKRMAHLRDDGADDEK